MIGKSFRLSRQTDGVLLVGPETMGPGMMGGGMMGHGFGHHDWDRGRASIAGSMTMRLIFSLMGADGDGELTFQEFQAAHERIFKAMDADHDGTINSKMRWRKTFMRER